MSPSPKRPPMRLLDDRRKALDSESMAQFLGGADLGARPEPAAPAPAAAPPAPEPAPEPPPSPPPAAAAPEPPAHPAPPPAPPPAPRAAAASSSSGSSYVLPRKQHPKHRPQPGTAVRVRGGRLEVEGPLPWEQLGDGAAARSFTLRLTGEELEKLRFVSTCIPGMSIQRFVHEATMEAVERALEELLDGRRR